MKIAEIITEAVTPIWGRKGGRMARRYRCTAGIRKGRIVSNPATCTKPKNIQKSISFRKTLARRGGQIRIKTGRTKRSTFSRRVKRLNAPKTRTASRKSTQTIKRKPIRK
jgi:hypothetical protein